MLSTPGRRVALALGHAGRRHPDDAPESYGPSARDWADGRYLCGPFATRFKRARLV